MKKTLSLVLIYSFISNKNISQNLWQINKDTVINWYFNNGDEFNEDAINTSKWSYWYGWSRNIFFHKEQQYYTDGLNHQIENGNLNLFAKREQVLKKIVDHLPDNDSIFNKKTFTGLNKRTFDYTSGMIQSIEKYKYGYFEIKFKMPNEKGYWPAFWMQGGFPNEEIDWMELKTDKKNAIHVGRHSQKNEENKIRNVFRKKSWGDWVYFKGNLSDNWNIVSGEWNPDYIKYYLNGECIAYTKVSLNIEKTLCANLAVPGKDGAFHPAPDTSIRKSGDYKIDYIRVWSKEYKPTLNENRFKQTSENILGKTKLKSKTKFLYGKKSIHKNEGIFVSLMPIGGKKFELQITGKLIPENAFYTIKNETSAILINEKLKYGFTIIDISNLEGTAFNLTINYLNQKVTHTLLKFN
jgi:beta-glucanase (GH16 family)